MGAWLAPVAAAAAWAAVLMTRGWRVRPAIGWGLMVLGAVLAVAGFILMRWSTRVRPRAGPALLRLAGLVSEERAPVADPRETVLEAARAHAAPGSPAFSWRAVAAVAAVVVGTSFLAGGSAAARSGSPGVSALAGAVGGIRAEVAISGDPSNGPYGWSGAATVVGFTDARGSWSVREPVWLQGRDRAPPLELGDRAIVTGVARPAPEEPGFGDYLRARGIRVTVRVAEIARTGGSPNPLLGFANAVRRSLQRAAHAVLPQPKEGLFLGLAVGDTSRLDPGVEEDFRATGLGHLLAVSGSNVAMFLMPVLAAAAGMRIGRRGRFVVGLLAIGFFALLTRAEPSVLRASVMAGLGLAGVVSGRPRSAWPVMGTAVLVLLLWDPGLAEAMGFQLSVLATIGMVSFAGPVAERIPGPRPLALAAGATIGAQAAVTPLLLLRFEVVPTTTLPANLLAFPAVGPALLLGLIACGLWLLWPAAGSAIAGIAGLPIAYLTGVADRMATAPLPSLTSDGGVGWFLAGMAGVVWAAWRIGRRREGPRRLRGVRFALAIVALPVVVWTRAVPAGPPSGLQVIFFDVGQGDAALVRSPAGATILIDAGPEPDVVATKLAKLGVKRLDVVIATHPHADHVAGFPAVLARFAVGTVLEPGCVDESPTYAAFARVLQDEDLPVRHPRAGETITAGDVRMEVLGPDGCYVATNSDANNDSVVVRLSVGGDSVLFTGDAEEPAQEAMLDERPERLEADVLKVPHHGGGTSVEAFLVASRARLAVVSVGRPNDYGHPVPEIMAVLRAAGMELWRTDDSGDLTLTFGPGGEPLVESARVA